jgi:S-adenosylmethionine:tRNA ribosyltransferase-isomerase
VKTSQFSFDLPEELIAQEPAAARDGARLLVLDRASGVLVDGTVRDLPALVEPGTTVILNDSRVRKARLFAESAGGARAEFILLERHDRDHWEALAGRTKRLKPGKEFSFPGNVKGTVVEIGEGLPVLRFDPPIDDEWLEKHGHVPLPPYIRRPDTPRDEERYQTTFSRVMGSAAAPTAGLHFTPQLIQGLRDRGARVGWITLHVGLGTFLPVRTDEIEDHVMHEEVFSVPRETRELVDGALQAGGKILAVGTTVVRTLESACTGSGLREGDGRTRIYMTPGYSFRVVNQLFTNFHTPRSSLLVLVSAFAGRELILRSYEEAVRRRYRFFSYGDAMYIR